MYSVLPRIVPSVALALLSAALPISAVAQDPGDTPPATPATHPATQPATRPTAAQRILIFSVDGLRPDLLLRSRTPNMHDLFENGTFSFWARTTPHAITLPSHTSMVTGVIPRKHEIEWNKDLPLAKPVYPKYPTLFGVARRAGYTTALAAGKSKFDALAEPGTVNWQWITDSEKAEDPDVARQAVAILRSHRPQVMFVHLPTIDNVGHKMGWGSPEQVKAVEGADKAVGMVLNALEELNLRGETIVLLTADHGGAGRTHLPDDARARHIPWIVNGPGIRKGIDLTRYADLVINTEDTFATACHLLGLTPGKGVDGKPVMEILEDRGELLHTPGDVATGAADAK